MSIRPSSSPTRTATEVRAKTIAAVERFYRPQKPDPQVASRKSKHDGLCRLAADHGAAWITSIPGSSTAAFECLPGSTFPGELRELGLKPVSDGEGERILAAGITERLGRAADGSLVGLTEGSTLPIVEIRHAGICRVERWKLGLS